MPFVNTRQLKEFVLARASEQLSGSQFNDLVIDYLNRAYTTLASGANEYTPEYIDDWWWHRAGQTITIDKPVVAAASLTNGSASGTFSAAIADSMAGRRLVSVQYPDLLSVSAHTAATDAFTLTSAWGGPTGSYEVTLYEVQHTMSAPVHGILGLTSNYDSNLPISVLEREDFYQAWPPSELTAGVPRAAMLLDETTITFSHGGLEDTDNLRIFVIYKPQIIGGLTDDPTSEPTLLPKQWRHVLADMALPFLLQDKNDERMQIAAQAARSAVAAMVKENRRRQSLQNKNLGKITPRPGIADYMELKPS